MTNTETVSTERLALQAIKDRLQSAFGAGVWDMPSPNPNGASRWEHQQAALFSIIETCDKALREASRTQSPAEWQVLRGHRFEICSTLEAAKAAAQADYEQREQRIRSALETPPLHKEWEAVKHSDECGCGYCT